MQMERKQYISDRPEWLVEILPMVSSLIRSPQVPESG